MATGTNGIATQLDANTLHINATGAATGPYTDSTQMNRCITYSSAISAGFKVNNADRYTSNTNRLVRYSDLAPGINTFRFRFAIDSIDDDNYLDDDTDDDLADLTIIDDDDLEE